jgi:hypothetical protein
LKDDASSHEFPISLVWREINLRGLSPGENDKVGVIKVLGVVGGGVAAFAGRAIYGRRCIENTSLISRILDNETLVVRRQSSYGYANWI